MTSKTALEARAQLARHHRTTGDDLMRRIARDVAKRSHIDNFSSRRGIEPWDDIDVLAVYNNNKYPDPSWRRDELRRFRLWLKEAGIAVLASANYGEGGYTHAMVLDADPSRQSAVRMALQDCLHDGGNAWYRTWNEKRKIRGVVRRAPANVREAVEVALLANEIETARTIATDRKVWAMVRAATP